MMKSTRTKTTRLANSYVVSVLALMIAAPAAYAQDAQAPTTVDTIFVVAQRRAENLQDVPIAINAFSSEQLERSGIDSVADLQFQTAGLKVANLAGLARITLRGIGTNGLSPTAEAGVASYLDGVFLGSSLHQSRAFYDIERVEILRGPQSALYGRNATGGAINIITKAPTKAFEAGGEVTVGNYDLFEAEGYVSGPLVGDVLSGRLAFHATKRDGYTPNIAGGDALDDADDVAVRGRLTYQPTDALRIDLTADYSRDRSNVAFIARRVNPAQPMLYEVLGGQLGTGRNVGLNVQPDNRVQTRGYGVNASWDLGWARLVSVTAYRDAITRNLSDFDFTTLPVAAADSRTAMKQTTQDVYLVSEDGGSFDWIIGATYFKEETNTRIFADLGIGALTLSSPKMTSKAYAAYAEGTYHVTDQLAVTAGARYTHEKKTFTEADTFTGLLSPVFPAPFNIALGPLSDTFNEFTPRATVTYEATEDVMAYATISTGFKAGGFNSLSSQMFAFEPETNINYEVGVKSELFDRRLRLNVSAFQMDYKDLQVQQRRVVPPSPLAVLVVDNAAKARIKGVEVEVLARPTERISVNGNLSYLDAKYREYAAIDEFDPAGFPANIVSVKGKRLIGAPEWSLNLGAQYDLPLSGLGTLSFRGEYAYQSAVFNNPTNAAAARIPPYDWFNARVTLRSEANTWRVAAWIKNVTDEDVSALRWVGAFDAIGSQTTTSIQLPPRTYGVTLGYNF